MAITRRTAIQLISGTIVSAPFIKRARAEEGKLFRFTVKHSIFLASVFGIIVSIYAYSTR